METEKITVKKLCGILEHTILKASASKDEIKKHCKEAVDYNIEIIVVNSYPVKFCKDILKGSGVKIGATISFPLGATTLDTKLFEAEAAIRDGANEIDYVLNISEVKNKNFDYIKIEMEKIVSLCRNHNVVSKVIFDNCYLTKEEITAVANIAKEVKPDFIKTSTGFGPSGATLEDVTLMKNIVLHTTVRVKASGGIRTLEDCKAMINAGAERIGTSNTINILKEV